MGVIKPLRWPIKINLSSCESGSGFFRRTERTDQLYGPCGKREELGRPHIIQYAKADRLQFINQFETKKLMVHHDLKTCTKHAEEASVKVDGQSILLAEMPGFDNSEMSMVDVVLSVIDYSHKAYATCEMHSNLTVVVRNRT